MGPQLHRCGKSLCTELEEGGIWSFNGAATSSLRKEVTAQIDFNEIPLLQWGRNFIVAESLGCFLRLVCSCFASMGPQLHRCGKCTARSRGASTRACFNGAATSSLRKEVRAGRVVARRDRVLQWGRNFIVAESRPRLRGHGRGRRASMGPQLHRCGKPPRGPPPIPRSAGFNGAATSSLRKVNDTCERHGIEGSFNGAATSSLRKASVSRAMTSVRRGLQWGRNFIVAESRSQSLFNSKPRFASMGPQLHRCGKLYRDAGQIQLRWLLQWGRNFIVAESNRFGRKPFPGKLLQWGRNFIVAESGVRGPHDRAPGRASMGPQLHRCGKPTCGPQP